MGTSLLNDDVRNSICIEDVTEDKEKLRAALYIVAESYSKLSSKTLDPEEVYKELCNDGYHSRGLSRTLLATGLNPNTDKIEKLGTVRFVLGSSHIENSNLQPLESMSLITPREGWEYFNFEGFDPMDAVELSRFVIVPNIRKGISKEIGLPIFLCRRFIDETKRISVDLHRKNQIWAIMPWYTVRIVKSGGVKLIPAPLVTLNYQGHSSLFKRYDKYWIHSDPWFYKFIV